MLSNDRFGFNENDHGNGNNLAVFTYYDYFNP